MLIEFEYWIAFSNFDILKKMVSNSKLVSVYLSVTLQIEKHSEIYNRYQAVNEKISEATKY